MTNLEYIRTLSEDELAKILCNMTECYKCLARDYCISGHNGFIDWLKEESDEE